MNSNKKKRIVFEKKKLCEFKLSKSTNQRKEERSVLKKLKSK